MILDQTLYSKIMAKKDKLDSLRPLTPSLVNRLREQAIIEWTYNSNAIEGTSLSLKETELIIEHGLTIKGKTLKEHFEAVNHKEAILFLEKVVKERKFKINSRLIRQIHGFILKGIDDQNAGQYRQVQVRITGSKHLPPLASLIPLKMRRFENWLKNKKNQKNIVEYAAFSHFKLVHIHPFIDGNGRTARLLMNLILMKKGFPPAVILKNDRVKYYQVLESAHQGQFEAFIDFVGRNVERSLIWYLDSVLPDKKKKTEEKWQLLSKLAHETPYSQEYLSLLARRGRIEAVKKERKWYSHLKAVKEYQKEIGKDGDH